MLNYVKIKFVLGNLNIRFLLGILEVCVKKFKYSLLSDRLRTVVNVMGDGIGCGFVQAMVERSMARGGGGGESTTNRLTLPSISIGGKLDSYDSEGAAKTSPKVSFALRIILSGCFLIEKCTVIGPICF